MSNIFLPGSCQQLVGIFFLPQKLGKLNSIKW